MNMPSRDSWVWWGGAALSLCVMLASLTTGNPENPTSLGYYGIPDAWAPYLRLGSLLSGWVSGKMATSPRPSRKQQKHDAVIEYAVRSIRGK